MIVALVPLKRLTEAKSRLSQALTVPDRVELVLHLLRHTLEALQRSRVVDRIMLVTPDSALGGQLGVDVLPDTGSLNSSLGAAVRWAVESGVEKVLIMPADLPFLAPDDIRQIVHACPAGRGIVVAATEDRGTAALLLSPPDVVPLAFGPDSAAQHVRLACERGVSVRRVNSQTLGFDLDTVADLQQYLASTRR